MMQFWGKGTLARPRGPWIPAGAGMTIGVRRDFTIVLPTTLNVAEYLDLWIAFGRST